MNKRHRSYCFTWNNYTVENIAHLTQSFMDIGVKKYIFQEEIGEEGTPHLQGVVCFRNGVWFNSLKRIDKCIHWEVTRPGGLPGSIKYCSKLDTRKKGSSPYKYGIKDTETWSSKTRTKIYKDIGPDKSYLAMKKIMIAAVEERCSREMNKIRLERLYRKEDEESEDWLFRNNRIPA